MLLIIVTAILPALLLGWWIYRKDSLRPEPLKQLYRAFLFGVGSAFVSLLISTLMGLMGLMVYDLGSYTGAVSTALFAAALPEEVAKLTMLWLFLRKNPYYDEYFDGIVYAACVGLGFAATENVLYLLQSEDWVMTGLIRGITAVPAHFAIACAMGYFYSKRHFGDNSRLTAVCVLAVPIIIHWVYDALAFSESINPAVSVVINILFILLIWRVYSSTMRRIGNLQQLDRARMTPPPVPGAPPTITPPPLPGSDKNNNTPLA
ncbi:MAG: PrsW family intramembrane metalloprotease [Muribaculaceae bacterium]|nr:PrsW family intramembrane metalloprotease [Muribaculaceae bacterium]